MLSLSNIFDKDDLVNFEKIQNYLNLKSNLFLSIVLNQKLMEFQHLLLIKKEI